MKKYQKVTLRIKDLETIEEHVSEGAERLEIINWIIEHYATGFIPEGDTKLVGIFKMLMPFSGMVKTKALTKNYGKDSFDYRASKFLLENLKSRNIPSINTILRKKTEDAVLQEWADVVRKMRELDKYSEDEIAGVIKFSVKDAFWKNNCLSMEKYRKVSNNTKLPFFVMMVDKIVINGCEAREFKSNSVGQNLVSEF